MPVPTKLPFLVSLRGDEAYAKFLEKLRKALAKEGIKLDSNHRLAEHALAELGERHGLKVPPRARPVGANQHGDPPRGDPV